MPTVGEKIETDDSLFTALGPRTFNCALDPINPTGVENNSLEIATDHPRRNCRGDANVCSS